MEILKDYVGLSGIQLMWLIVTIIIVTPTIRKLRQQLQEEKERKTEAEQPVKVEQ